MNIQIEILLIFDLSEDDIKMIRYLGETDQIFNEYIPDDVYNQESYDKLSELEILGFDCCGNDGISLTRLGLEIYKKLS